GSTVCQCRWFASVVVDSKVGKMPIPKATNFRIGTLVSCPRSSLPLAANVGDKQVTEIKELVSRFRPPLMSRNFGIGTLDRLARQLGEILLPELGLAPGVTRAQRRLVAAQLDAADLAGNRLRQV